jgi:hypothetical protein
MLRIHIPAEGGKDLSEKTPRVKKADRGFAPEGLNLRPSSYQLTEQLYDFFQSMRNDYGLANAFETFSYQLHAQAAEANAWKTKPVATSYVPKIRVRASELKECSRKVGFRLMGFPDQPVGENQPWWAVSASTGQNLHQLIDHALQYLGLTKKSEFSVASPSGNLTGRVDHLLEGAVMDVKSVSTDTFKEGAWGDKIPGYIAQLSAYAAILGVPKGVVLLLDRGTGRLMDFEWDIDAVFALSMLDRADFIVAAVKEREVLPAEEKIKNGGKPTFGCLSFCPFAQLCWKEETTGYVSAWLAEGKDPKEIR